MSTTAIFFICIAGLLALLIVCVTIIAVADKKKPEDQP